MTTRLRSACDRCHSSKIRCSGEVPCQACLMSQSLCFYSVSCPLGRPKRPKNKNSHGRADSNSIRKVDVVSNKQITSSMSEHRVSKRTPCKRSDSATNGCHEDVMARTNNDQRYDVAGSLDLQNCDSSWLASLEENQDPFDFPESALCSALGTELATSNVQAIPDMMQCHFEDLEEPEGRFDTEILHDNWFDEAEIWSLQPLPGNPASTITEVPNDEVTSRGSLMKAPQAIMASSQDLREAIVPKACTCLQQNASLLSNPNIAELNASEGSDCSRFSLDKAILLVRQGTSAWRDLIACPRCPYQDDQEAVMLAYMGVRSVTRYLQRLGSRYAHTTVQTPHCSSINSNEDPIRLMVGTLEVDGDERTSVLRLLFLKTLQSVRQTLHLLQKTQSKRKKHLQHKGSPERTTTAGAVVDYQISSGSLHIQQVSHALTTSLQELEAMTAGI